jgi:hypothetical protein
VVHKAFNIPPTFEWAGRVTRARWLVACMVVVLVGASSIAVLNVAAEQEATEKTDEGSASEVHDSSREGTQEDSASTQSNEKDAASEAEGDGSSAKEHETQKDAHQKTSKGDTPSKRTPVPIPGGDPRGAPDLVVCSQNLKLFGKVGRGSGADQKKAQALQAEKIRGLVARFTGVGCDVIGVQEVIAPTANDAKEVLEQLALELRRRTNRFFKVVVSPPSEGQMTNGFLLALDRVSLEQSLPYSKVELPRISKKQRPRLFSRPPLEVQLSVKARDSEIVKPIAIVNFHFKSKRGGKDDPTGMEWETYRMEMSEALRRIVELRHKESFASGESLLLLLGDRNSNFDVASARILEGSLVLSSFAEKGPCRMSKRGLPLCVAETTLPRKLFSVLTTNDGVKEFPGTFNYQGEFSWLDDILMPAESLRFAWKTAFSEGEYDSGLVQTPATVSDHALVYVKLNW